MCSPAVRRPCTVSPTSSVTRVASLRVAIGEPLGHGGQVDVGKPVWVDVLRRPDPRVKPSQQRPRQPPTDPDRSRSAGAVPQVGKRLTAQRRGQAGVQHRRGVEGGHHVLRGQPARTGAACTRVSLASRFGRRSSMRTVTAERTTCDTRRTPARRQSGTCSSSSPGRSRRPPANQRPSSRGGSPLLIKHVGAPGCGSGQRAGADRHR